MVWPYRGILCGCFVKMRNVLFCPRGIYVRFYKARCRERQIISRLYILIKKDGERKPLMYMSVCVCVPAYEMITLT